MYYESYIINDKLLLPNVYSNYIKLLCFIKDNKYFNISAIKLDKVNINTNPYPEYVLSTELNPNEL